MKNKIPRPNFKFSPVLNLFLLLLTLLIVKQTSAQQNELKNIQDQAFELIFKNQNKAIVLIDSLIKEHENNKTYVQGINLSHKGVYYAVQNQLDSAAVYFNKAIELTPKKHKFYPNLLNNLSIVYKKKGDFSKAIETLNEALIIANSQNNKDAKAKIYSELSSSYRGLNKYNLAIKYSLNSIDVIKSKDSIEAYPLNVEKQKLANLYRALDNNTFANQLYKEILPYFEKSFYTDAKISTYINYAASLINVNELSKAEVLLLKSKKELDNFYNEELFAFYKLTYALYYKKLGDFDKAENCFEIALSSFKNHLDNYPKTLNEYLYFLKEQKKFNKIINFSNLNQGLDSMQVGFQDLVDYNGVMGLAYENAGNYKKSIFHFKNKIRYSDSLNQLNNFAIAKDLQAKYQIEIIQQKNISLQKNIQSETRKNIAIIAFSLFLGVVLLSFILRYRIKLINETKLKEVYAKKIDAEKKLITLKDALLEEQKKELLSKSLETSSLSKKLKLIKSKIDKTSLNEKLSDVEEYLTPQNELRKLNYEFQRAYPNFESQLLRTFPDLSKNDILFLSFIKLNFSFKEIAAILNITHQSVITKKYRISKKIQLTKDVDIYEFINNEIN